MSTYVIGQEERCRVRVRQGLGEMRDMSLENLRDWKEPFAMRQSSLHPSSNNYRFAAENLVQDMKAHTRIACGSVMRWRRAGGRGRQVWD